VGIALRVKADGWDIGVIGGTATSSLAEMMAMANAPSAKPEVAASLRKLRLARPELVGSVLAILRISMS
jgi:hypothetical protein